MRIISGLVAALLACSTQAAQTNIAGAAYCVQSTDTQSTCQVGWRWTADPPSRLLVERFEPSTNRWWLVEETVGSKRGKSNRAVDPGALYRVRACVDPMIESTCIESSAFWAPHLPKSADEVPEFVVTPRGRIFKVSKNLPLGIQTQQYNAYQLESAMEGVDPQQLPPMTPPVKTWGAEDFTAADNLANNIYDLYGELRKAKPPKVIDPAAPKEFISDVPRSEWAQFRTKRIKGWAEESAITFGPTLPSHTITVFVDVTCEHCAQMVQDLDELASLGIRVQFLAYPMSGPNTLVGQKMADIWCADDPESALRAAMLGGAVLRAQCPRPIVAFHYALAKQLDLSGSPSILNEKGDVIGGYLPPKDLLRALERAKQY